jgi:hypothetical protein
MVHDLPVTENGILLRYHRIVVPESLKQRVVRLAHVGHQGIVKTKALIRSRVWFRGIDRLVEQAISKCEACQANTGKKQFVPMVPSEMPKAAWNKVSGDFFGPMSDGKHWFVNYDEYSRWIAVDQISTTSFEEVKKVLDNPFNIFGPPETYKTDNGSPFFGHAFRAYAQRWGFQHRKITPLWPIANGEVERFMDNLGKVLRVAKAIGQNKTEALNDFLRAYRETPHTTTKVAPALLMMGRSNTTGIPQMPFGQESLAKFHQTAIANDKAAKAHMKQEYDDRMRTREHNLSVGQRVYMWQFRTDKSVSNWDPKPFEIVNINGSQVTVQKGGRKLQETLLSSSQ